MLLTAAPAPADYLVASRHALVKDAPQRDGATIMPVERDDVLLLASEEQTNGYYEVLLAEGQPGWVYRTFVRRFPGDPPGFEPIEPEPIPIAPADAIADSPFAYAGIPISENPVVPVRVLQKAYFTIGYSEERRNPLWVCYAIGPAADMSTYPRKNFGTDSETSSKVTHANYTNSGYSRGHMAPKFAIGSRFGLAGSNATFVMTNVCPQFQDYNDGQWGNLEEWIGGKKLGNGSFIDGWADEYEFVWVIVGPIFDEDREPLEAGVEVPNAFYCIVVDEEQGQPRVLAFILEHEDERDGDLGAALKTVREIEDRTGLDFFSSLPDAMEEQLETVAALFLWSLPVNPN